jgi:dTDP-4-dehydrorhamnose 3,5-epimerase
MPITVRKTPIEGLVIIESQKFLDDRGYFLESYKRSDFAAAGLPEFVQDNLSFSKHAVLRGLHYQLFPEGQGKLVRALTGRIWDAAVDIRKISKTFGKWFGMELSDKSTAALYIPEGFAHGFVVLSETALVMYKTTSEYDPKLERGIIWNDPNLKIDWPIKHPIVSRKDAKSPLFENAEYV